MKSLTESEILKIQEAVTQAEKHTSGEIVPLIVKKSSFTGHVFFITSLLWLLLLITLNECFKLYIFDLGLESYTWLVALLGLIAFYYFRHSSFLLRLVTKDEELLAQVLTRAELELSRVHLTETKARTGILIFISLLEHKCVVLADKGISDKLPPETWQKVVNAVVTGIKKGRMGEGLIDGIRLCGEILAKHLPPEPNNPNEICNRPIIKD
jgi:putative membrane protein